MIFQPISNEEFHLIPESEVDEFYVNQFLNHWKNGTAKLVLKSGIMGSEPQNKMELRACNLPLIPFSFNNNSL